MKTLHPVPTQKTQLALAAADAGERRVLEACARAQNDLNTASLSCLIAGQLLAEHRTAMRSCHRGKSLGWHDGTKEKDDQFTAWLDAHGIAQRTAYRWMDVAGRVAKLTLGLQTFTDLPAYIDVEAQVTLSQALTADEKELSGKALKFRQDVFGFMADKTLSEALNACVEGDSPGSRITRAAGGKGIGQNHREAGGGGDRKAFDVFTARKLQHLTTFFHRKLTVNQKGEIVAAFNRALEAWPRWVIEALAEKSRAELKLDEEQRQARGGF